MLLLLLLLQVGIIPRALTHLFRQIQEKQATGDQVEVSIGFLEIYQEEVFDLLSVEEKVGLPIREEGGVMHVAGAVDETVTG